MSGLEDLIGGGSSGGVLDLLGDPVGGVSDIVGKSLQGAGFVAVIAIIALIGLIAAHYAFNAITVRNIGRKAGLEKDWMAYVPFARAIYRLQIVNEQWWKMFFLEYWLLYAFIINWFFGLFQNDVMATFGTVLAVLFVLAQLAYRVYYRNKFNKAFGIKNEMSLSMITFWGTRPWGPGILTKSFDSIIAYTNLLDYGEAKNSKSLGQVLHNAPKSNVKVSGNYSITGMSGMYAGQEFPMAPNDELLIGRDASMSNIIIAESSDKVSRKHCGISFDTNRNMYMVTDYSTNGTFIDGGSRLVANVPTAMPRGTVIALGSRENRFKLN